MSGPIVLDLRYATAHYPGVGSYAAGLARALLTARPHWPWRVLVPRSSERFDLSFVPASAREAGNAPAAGPAQVALGAGNGDVLKHIAARIHQRNDDTGEGIAENERATHRQERDRIDAHSSGPQVPHNRDRKGDNDRYGRKRPRDIGKAGTIHDARRNARRQSKDSDRKEHAPQDALDDHRFASLLVRCMCHNSGRLRVAKA